MPQGPGLRRCLDLVAPAGIVAMVVALSAAPVQAAPAATDITAQITANHNVSLAGDSVVRLPAGITTYTGVISGAGTVTVTGTGTLVLIKDSDFTLPVAQQRQKLVTYNGNHPLTRLDNADKPAVIVAKGATLQYGDGSGSTGQFAHYVAYPGGQWNLLSIEVDGTLDVAVHAYIHLGTMSGTGLITARRNTWPGVSLAGSHSFSGTYVNGTGFDYGSVSYNTQMPNLATIVNYGSAIHSAADGQTVIDGASYYSKTYGNDINYHTWGSGVVRNTGVYSWSDNDSLTDPTLSDPALNFSATVAHHDNKRGVNIEGANVEWGDGTTNRFFVPGNAQTAYINMHFDGRERSKLTFNYNGPVTLGLPIGGGKYHDTLAAPGQGDVVIAPTPGNAVTFTAVQDYDGSTTIGHNASLRLGNGTPNFDGGLLIAAHFQIVDDGELIASNAVRGIKLSNISGGGSFRQAGPATTTFTGTTTYRGSTTIAAGTLAVTGSSLATSSAVNLTASGARLDLTGAGAQTLPNLAGTTGSTVAIAAPLTLLTTAPGMFAGIISGTGSVTKTGGEVLTLTGEQTTAGQQWTIAGGTLALTGAGAAIDAATVTTNAAATLKATGTIDAALVNSGLVDADKLQVRGNYRQQPGASLTANSLTVGGSVTLAGKLVLAPNQTATVIDNRGTKPVAGIFDNLPEGATIDGHTITYHGGDGNDVVLVGGHFATANQHRAGGSDTTGHQVAFVLQVAGGAAVLLVAAAATLLALRRRRRTASSLGAGPVGRAE